MSLYVVEKLVEGVILLDMRGELTLGSATAMLRDHVKRLIEKDYRRVVIDLWEVSYIDSVGLSTLVECHAVGRAHGVEIKLLRLNKRVVDLMRMTQLNTVFEIYDTFQQATASYGGTST